MNIDNDNMEQATDLGLTLDYSGDFIRRPFNIESGAGVNAGLVINIPFVASSPLSELVWSPDKGLRIKCAESTFMDSRPSILLGAGQTNAVLSPIDTMATSRTSNDKPVDNLLTPGVAMHVCEEVSKGNCLFKCPRNDVGIIPIGESSHKRYGGTGGCGEGTKTVEVSLQLLHTNQEEDPLRDVEGKEGASDDILSNRSEVKANELPVEPSFESTGGGIYGTDNQTLGREIVLATHILPMNECEASNFIAADIISLGRKRRAEQASVIAVESKSKVKKIGLEKPESTNENDFLSPIGKDASKYVPSESTREVQYDLLKDEEALPLDEKITGKNSPSNCEIGRHRRKGKEKVLSDGDIQGRKSEDEDSSHESVESCNSAQLSPTGKKRWNFEQMLMQNKRAKKEIQESPCSASFVRKDSSFMNWISNMVKGFGKPVEDKERFTPLALTQPHHGDGHTSQKLILRDKTQDSGNLNMGFQSIFKSLYCLNKVVNDSRPAIETEMADKISDIDATPIAYHRESGMSCKQFMLSNEEVSESRSNTEVGLSTKPKVPPANSDSVQEKCKTSSAENKNSYALVLGNNNEGFSSKSSLGKHKTNNSTENNDSDRPSEGKRTHILSNRSDALGSLWITRFSSKTSGPLPHVAHYNQSVVSTKLDSHLHSNPLEARVHSTEDYMTSTNKELQNAANAEVSSSPARKFEPTGTVHDSTSKLQYFGGSKRTLQLLASKESGEVFEPSLKHKLNEMVASEKMISGTTVVNRCIASSSAKNELRKGPLSIQMPEMQMGIFEAIKKLRLSRTDILKWMNSHISLSHLNGLFLRLRLGKWEEGIGGTGYYVACIAGLELESVSPNSRNVIPVNVGSIKCLVESQYISNHDFREDELIAWRSAAMRNGSEIPSIEELRAKVEEKNILGF